MPTIWVFGAGETAKLSKGDTKVFLTQLDKALPSELPDKIAFQIQYAGPKVAEKVKAFVDKVRAGQPPYDKLKHNIEIHIVGPKEVIDELPRLENVEYAVLSKDIRHYAFTYMVGGERRRSSAEEAPAAAIPVVPPARVVAKDLSSVSVAPVVPPRRGESEMEEVEVDKYQVFLNLIKSEKRIPASFLLRLFSNPQQREKAIIATFTDYASVKEYADNHPRSHIAKVFRKADSTPPERDAFDLFVQQYKEIYKSKFFTNPRSTMKRKLENGNINTWRQVLEHAQKNPTSRTAKEVLPAVLKSLQGSNPDSRVTKELETFLSTLNQPAAPSARASRRR